MSQPVQQRPVSRSLPMTSIQMRKGHFAVSACMAAAWLVTCTLVNAAATVLFLFEQEAAVHRAVRDGFIEAFG